MQQKRINFNSVLGQPRDGPILEHEAQHLHPRASRLTKTKENYSYALPFARLAAQARSSALLQAALIFRFFLGFS